MITVEMGNFVSKPVQVYVLCLLLDIQGHLLFQVYCTLLAPNPPLYLRDSELSSQYLHQEGRFLMEQNRMAQPVGGPQRGKLQSPP